MLIAISKGIIEDMPTMMITRITDLWISSDGISYPNLDIVNVCGRVTFPGHRKDYGRMFALDPVTSDLLLSIETTEDRWGESQRSHRICGCNKRGLL